MNSTLADPGVLNEDTTGAFRKRRSTVKTTPEMTKARNERLIRAIKAKGKSHQLDTKTLSQMFGMEYSQLNACYAGVRDFAYLTPNQRQRIANFLEVPPIQVHLWCGLVQPSDFLVETDYKQKLDHIYTNHMLADPMLCQIVPDEEDWKTYNDRTKMSFVLFYFSYTGSWLLNAAQAATNPAVAKPSAKKKDKDANKVESSGTVATTQDAVASTKVPPVAETLKVPTENPKTPEEAMVQAHGPAASEAPTVETPIISAADAQKAQSLVDSVLHATAKQMGTNVDAAAAPESTPAQETNSGPLITRRPRRIQITDSKTAPAAATAAAGTATTRTLKIASRPAEQAAETSEEDLIKMWPMTANMKPEDRRRFVAIAEQALREQSENTA